MNISGRIKAVCYSMHSGNKLKSNERAKKKTKEDNPGGVIQKCLPFLTCYLDAACDMFCLRDGEKTQP